MGDISSYFLVIKQINAHYGLSLTAHDLTTAEYPARVTAEEEAGFLTEAAYKTAKELFRDTQLKTFFFEWSQSHPAWEDNGT